MKNLLFIAIASVFGYFGFLYGLPYFIQHKAADKLGVKNQFVHKGIADDKARAVVAPNPDFLYSIAMFDVSKEPQHITGEVPDSTYFSLALYQNNTSNFFVKNDKNLGKTFDYLIVKEGTKAPKTNAEIIYTPSNTGTVLIRLLWYDKKQIPALVEKQKTIRFVNI